MLFLFSTFVIFVIYIFSLCLKAVWYLYFELCNSFICIFIVSPPFFQFNSAKIKNKGKKKKPKDSKV